MRAIATNAKIAQTITKAGGDYLLAVKANQPTLRAETQSAFAAAAALDTYVDHDNGRGRIDCVSAWKSDPVSGVIGVQN